MKAILLMKAGGVENLQLSEVDKPSIQNDEVLVATQAISLNPADVKPKYSDQMLNMFFGPNRPLILGWDIAGVVEEVGSAVKHFRPGDRVFGMINFPGVGKAYAEFVAAPAAHLAKMPEGTSFEAAAATTLAALTALQILEGRIKKGDRVLVQGGSGGVGHFGIQIAKAMGAYVITTSSGKNRDFVMSIGADEHIDYQTQAFEEELSNVDFVLDIFGGKVLENSIKVLAEGGTIFSTAARDFSADIQSQIRRLNGTISSILVESSGEDMNTLKGMMEAGTLKPHIYKTFPLAQMAEAHTEVEKGRTVGKIVVTV
ncbi:NADP-dependent oxidoreductase [Pontibacter sp. G13]|uniref:NADP-dependent oxidoreductase n=1 Tax=Pontibacter sp. G13 TaxID=3074898 RepID=UPI00288B01C6|nr:NADP-dependent oxidoreductase [Pontibacter sp. G13]WNJ21267.1 NADP-dependent oxidoreductase [Pontibacter sp. G13]